MKAKYVCPDCMRPTSIKTRAEINDVVFDKDGNVVTGSVQIANLVPADECHDVWEFIAECCTCHYQGNYREFTYSECTRCDGYSAHEDGEVEEIGGFLCEDCLKEKEDSRDKNAT